MKQRDFIIGIVALLYGLFWRWYTGSRKPLTPDEVDRYMAKVAAMNPDPVVADRLHSFLASDTGRGFVMVNLIKLNEPETVSSSTLNRYTSVFLPAILKRAGHPVLVGKAAAEALELWGVDNGEKWSTVGLVRYRSRRDMIEDVLNPNFAGIHPFKRTAIQKTIAVPVDPWFYAGDPRLLVGLLALIGVLSAQWSPRKRSSSGK